jgi:hypothetical protein
MTHDHVDTHTRVLEYEYCTSDETVLLEYLLFGMKYSGWLVHFGGLSTELFNLFEFELI